MTLRRTTSIVAWLVVGGLVVAMAVPFFQKQRREAQRNACIANLRQIDGAVHGWALVNAKKAGEPIQASDIEGYLKDGHYAVCPAGGIYPRKFRVGELVSCSVPGHTL